MAWTRIDAELEGHPKLIRLAMLIKGDRDSALGKINRFWWWAQKYAEDGDLRRFLPEEINSSLGVENFVEHLTKAGFIDTVPYLRIHDWWEYIGPWLNAKYKKSPKKWQRVRKLYSDNSRRSTVNKLVTVTSQLPTSDVTAHRRDVTKITKEKTAVDVYAHVKDTAAPSAESFNPENNGHGASSNGDPGNDPSPNDDRARLVTFIKANAPRYERAWVFNPADEYKKHTLETMMGVYCVFGLKALWILFIQPGHGGYTMAHNFKFSCSEFLRQIPMLIASPAYDGLKNKYRAEEPKAMAFS